MKKLDLHEITHSEVRWTVENFIGKETVPFEIVTGNSKKMKEIVINILNEHDFKWIIWSKNVGSISVVDH